MKKLAGLGLVTILAAWPLGSWAEPIAFEQAANVTGLAGVEVGANFDYSYEKIEKSGIPATEDTLSTTPVFVRVGIPVLEGKLTIPYGSVKSNIAAVGEQNYSGIQNIGLMLKTGLLTLPILSLAVGVDTTFPNGDGMKYLREGLAFNPFVAAGIDAMFLKLHANVGYRYRAEYSAELTGFDTTTMQPTVEQGVKVKPGDDINFALGLEIPASNLISLHAELLGHTYGKVSEGGVELADSAGSTLTLVPGIRLHAGPLKVKVGYGIPMESKDNRPTLAPRSDWRIVAGAGLQFSL